MNNNTINVLYVSNDGYAGHLAASLISLLKNNRSGSHIHCYIFSVGMSEEVKEKLCSVAEGFPCQVEIIDLSDLASRFPYEIDTRGFDISAMGRLFAPELLPETVERVLYLDCDTIVLEDLSRMYRVSLGDKLAGMVMEPTVYKEMKDTIGMEKDEEYFNSGVILMDLAKWRERDVLKRLLDFYGAHSGNLFACDQDTINGALRGEIKSLPPRYNFFTNYRYFRYKTLCDLCSAYESVGEAAFNKAKKRPVIIHYLGDERPWIAGNHNHYKKYYEKYLAQTPWKDMEFQKGKWLYMQMWRGFNQLTRISPKARLMISRRFGMKIIDNRSKKK